MQSNPQSFCHARQRSVKLFDPMDNDYEPLHASFSTADAEYPQIVSDHGFLRVTFQDWREKTVGLVFHDVAAYSWDDGDAAIDTGHRDDCCYVVRDSHWLARHREVGTVMPSEGHRHFKLCFNAVGVLQVLASRLEVSTDEGTATDGIDPSTPNPTAMPEPG